LHGRVLQHALAVEPDSNIFDFGRITEVNQLVSICAGLVAIDTESGIIHLVHYTTHDYLKGLYPDAEMNIAKTCLTYLGLEIFTDPCTSEMSLDERLSDFAFSSYAAKYWAEHTRGNNERELRSFLLETFRSQGKRESMRQIQIHASGWQPFADSIGLSLLHIIAANGLAIVCMSLLDEGFDDNDLYMLYLFAINQSNSGSKLQINIEAVDNYGQTSLIWAARNGYTEVVQFLLNANANIEAVDYYGQTSLIWASRYGNTEVVQLLLNANANIEVVDNDGQTSLIWAAMLGHTEVVQLLLNENANIEAVDHYRQTSLIWAAKNGYTEIVQLLLNANANIEAVHFHGQTSLIWASRYGCAEVVQLLLNANANANIEAVDNGGQTSLIWAAKNGRAEVVQLLLNANANIEAVDNNGRTSLIRAAMNGHTEVVELLTSYTQGVKQT
jgi:ankyrin repeat protein